jgi:HK97 family phage portal protein
MAIAKAVSSCPPSHKVVGEKGKRVASTTSPASRVLRKPNAYQTWPQFILNSVAMELFEGESFVLMFRDDRYAVREIHLMPRGTCTPHVDPDTGEIFYAIGSNPMLRRGIDAIAPARDVIHLRASTPRHPLLGESPIKAAALALGVNVALSGNQAAFFSNMNRPSGILSTDIVLTKDQMQQLRIAFDEQAGGMNAGKIPVLSAGLKFSPMGISSQDAQLIEAQRMSIEEVARCFGVPLPIIGDLSKSTMNNAETVVNFWLATGLGSVLENLERSFDAAFGLPADEYIEFDERALLRMDYVKRIEALTKAIQGGILSPNEARDSEGLPPIDGGDFTPPRLPRKTNRRPRPVRTTTRPPLRPPPTNRPTTTPTTARRSNPTPTLHAPLLLICATASGGRQYDNRKSNCGGARTAARRPARARTARRQNSNRAR